MRRGAARLHSVSLGRMTLQVLALLIIGSGTAHGHGTAKGWGPGMNQRLDSREFKSGDTPNLYVGLQENIVVPPVYGGLNV